MFSLSPEDDDGSFGPAVGGGSSKLASLFGQDRASFTGGNESLTYTPPKQPRKDKTVQQTKGDAPAVQFATAVHAYRYVNGQYVNQGKLGAAVLANHSESEYKLLLYVSKEKQVSVTRIHSSFVFTVQANNYASFYDDQQQRWSVCFDSASNAIKFSKQIGVAMFNSAPTLLVCQDLVLGDGQAVEAGDMVEVKYTGWLWTNNSFGKVFDGNMESEKTFKFKTGKGKVIKGWDQGIIGTLRGGRRLIAIPSSLAYGEKGAPPRVPPNSSLLFEVELLRIKGKDNGANAKSTATMNQPQHDEKVAQSSVPVAIETPKERPSVEASSVGDSTSGSFENSSIKGRTASLNEQLSLSPGKGSDKARLLARMSKMGKNVLTLPGAVSAEPDEDLNDSGLVTSPLENLSSPELPSTTSVVTETTTPPSAARQANPEPHIKHKPHLPPRPVQPHPEVQQTLREQSNPHPIQSQSVVPTSYTSQPLAVYQPPQPVSYPVMPQQVFPQATFTYAQPAPPPPPPPPQAPSAASDAMVPVLMAENRQQQTEVRMVIGKVSDKIDELSHKVDKLRLSSGTLAHPAMSPNYGGSAAMMDTALLLHNITRIVQENEKLKVESAEKREKIEALNEKISDLLQKNQRFFEQSNTMLEQRSDSLQQNTSQTQARVLALEQEKIVLSSEVTTAKTQLTSTKTELSALRQQEADLRMQLSRAQSDCEKYKYELAHAKDSHTENEEQTGRLKQDLKEERQNRKRFESRMEHLEEDLSDLRHEKESLEKSLADRKKKHATDKKKFEEELEELKTQQEEEIRLLKERHRRDKQSSGTVSQEQMARFEAELEDRWKEKSGKMVLLTEEKWKRKYDELVEEKESLGKKLSAVEEKYSSAKTEQDKKEIILLELQEKVRELEEIQEKYKKLVASENERGSFIEGLQTRVAELESFQIKYQEMRSRTVQMKEQYEERLAQTQEMLETATEEAREKGFNEGKLQADGPSAARTSQSVMEEVKRIMNDVYFELRGEFNTDDHYTGTQIMKVILKTIKEITMKSLTNETRKDEGSDEEEEDDDEEEEDNEEEEEKEEEQEEEQEEEEEEQEQGKVVLEKEKNQEEGELEKVKMVLEKEENKDKGEEKEEEQEIRADEKNNELCNGENLHEKQLTESSNSEEELKNNREETTEKVGESLEKTEEKIAFENCNNTADIRELSLEKEEKKSENLLIQQAESLVENNSVPDLPDVLTGSSFEEVDNIQKTFEGVNQNSPEQPGEESVGEITKEGVPALAASLETNGDEQNQTQVETEKDSICKNDDKSNQLNLNQPKSLFGDDHDDVEATFGPLKPKEEEDLTPAKPTPPPLFDDDDDDDLDWLS